MTVQTTALRGDYTGNGVTTIFAVPFYFLENSHVQIEKLDTLTNTTTTLALTTDYTLAGAGVGTGGTATLLVAPLATDKIAITRNVPYTQQTHYVEGDPFPSQSHEAALDKLTMLAQQLDEESSRSVKAPASAAGFDGELPAMLASMLVATNAAGTGFELVAPSSGSAAELSIDLADTTDPLKGAGKIGYNPTLAGSYDAGTVGEWLGEALADIAAISASSGSSLVGFQQSGTGAVATTQEEISKRTVHLFDFLSDAKKTQALDGTTFPDVTTELGNAQDAGGVVIIPTCSITLDQFHPKNGKQFLCAGYKNTWIKQANAGRYGIHILSDATYGQIQSGRFVNFGLIGATSATVPALKCEAKGVYVINKYELDYFALNTFRALDLENDNGGNQIYSNKFKVDSYNSTDTAFVTMGTYNRYDLIAERCNNGKALDDGTINGYFDRCTADGQLQFGGQNCSIIKPTVETIYGTAVYSAMQFTGYNHVVLSPTLQEVQASKLTSGCGFVVYNQHTIVHPRIWGTDKPTHPFEINEAGSVSTIIGGSCITSAKIESYLSANILASLTLIGDCSTFSVSPGLDKLKYNYQTGTTYTIDASLGTVGLDRLVVFAAPGTCTVTLPSGAAHIGRVIRLHTRAAQAVVSASANVVPMTGGAGTAILAATVGKWADICYDGTVWNIVANN